MKSKLQEMLEDNDYNVRSYSGRGMFGKYCLGVVVENISELIKIGFMLGQEEDPEESGDTSDLLNVRTDSLGFDVIIYWPRINFVEDDEGT